MLRFISAGESHGPEILAILEGIPAGLRVDVTRINSELARRQGGYGRSARQRIEKDCVQITAGLKNGKTIGSPIAMRLSNNDSSIDTLHPISSPRPGHGDLAGALKYGTRDARDILERASARETAARVMAGALARQVLEQFDIDCFAYVQSIGTQQCLVNSDKKKLNPLRKKRDQSEFYFLDPSYDGDTKAYVNKIAAIGDTLGGSIAIIIRGLPAGLGNHTQWDRKLDGQFAQSLMSIPAIKGVEIGMGFQSAQCLGSFVHDEIFYKKNSHATSGGFYRKTNNAGGLEAGITNGEDLFIRAAMKPIATLRSPMKLKSVDLKKKTTSNATHERADITAVPAASVVLENMCALTCCTAFLDKFGGDSMRELSTNYNAYINYIEKKF